MFTDSIPTTIAGGDGNALNGGLGVGSAELQQGGDGADAVVGGKGNDTAALGDGNDSSSAGIRAMAAT